MRFLRSSPRPYLVTTVLTSLLAAASPVYAEASAADKAAAEALFVEAKKLLSEGRAAEACPKLAESQRLNPGLGTMLNLADCYEKVGQTASAWGLFNDLQAAARREGDTRGYEAEGARRAMLVEPKLSKLLVNAPSGGQVSGLVVRRDGHVLGAGLLGSAVPVDPGDHMIEASAPGRKAWSTVVEVEAKPGTMTVSIPELAPLPVNPQREDRPAPSTESGGLTAQRIAGVGMGGAGVAGVVIGSVFGGLTLGKSHASRDHCTKDLARCDQVGFDLQRSAATTAKISDAAIAIGGAALIAGVVLFVTAPRQGAPAKGTRALRVQVGPAIGGPAAGVWGRGEW